jgi:hypothetical protein
VAFSVLVHTDMSSPWLTRYGTEAQKRRYLPGIVSGETVCALGITEPGTGSDMAGIATRAVRDGDRYLLTGSKIFITNGVYGDLYFVAARTAPPAEGRRHQGISMFLVERGLPGFEVGRKLDKLGMRGSNTAELSFHDTPVPAENLLGAEGRGFQQLASGLQRERILAAVLALSGGSVVVAQMTQVALGTLAVWLVALTAQLWLGRRVALTAGLLAGLCGDLTFNEVLILQSSLDPFLTALGLWLLARAWRRMGASLDACGPCTAGAAALLLWQSVQYRMSLLSQPVSNVSLLAEVARADSIACTLALPGSTRAAMSLAPSSPAAFWYAEWHL